MDIAERELFAGAVRRAAESSTGEALDAALEDLGWSDALEDDTRAAVSLFFEAQGRAGVTSSALDQLLAHALGMTGERVAVVLPPLRRSAAPARLEGDRCAVAGLGTAALSTASVVIAVAPSGEGDAAFVLTTDALEARPIIGLDPTLGLFGVSGIVDVAGGGAPSDWRATAVFGQLAVSHELVGVSRAMLELARQHALERVQFGRPISTFQAVRHRLAESMVAIEAATGLLEAAWDEPGPTTAALAKGLAGRSARTVARHAQQVLAGIGFTTEHPFHRFFRRTVLLDQLLGAGTALTRDVGAGVLASGSLPAALPL
jgi:Acyl-CoA dehydrogenase, C-terminal domain